MLKKFIKCFCIADLTAQKLPKCRGDLTLVTNTNACARKNCWDYIYWIDPVCSRETEPICACANQSLYYEECFNRCVEPQNCKYLPCKGKQ